MTNQKNCFVMALLFGAFLSGLAGCAQVQAERESIVEPTAPLAGTGLSIGGPLSVGRLSVYPIHGAAGIAEQKIVSFDRALSKGDASVRELNADGSVGTLVVENHGKVAILVLAGTIVKGGKQDRQIGQDFVVAPGKLAEVDAYCVERGRWDEKREGKATAGKFEAIKTLATRKVREAGQYKKDQGEVWSKVAQENQAHGKHSTSDSLLATLDAGDVRAAIEPVTRAVTRQLDALANRTRVVGLAYAVGGDVKGARWFVTHDLYRENRETLLNTMALESSAGKSAPGAATPSAEDVSSFLSDLRASEVQETTKTRSLNRNRYRENEAGYSSEALVEIDGKIVEVSADYLAK